MKISLLFEAIFSLIYLFNFIQSGYIQSWDIETLEDFNGNPNGFKLHFNLESGLSMNEYIQINFADSITVVNSDLYLFENTLLLVSGINCDNYPISSKSYFCKYGVSLKANTWYTIVMNVNPLANWASSVIEPVEMITVSDKCSLTHCSPIIYDMNNYFGYLLRTPTPTPGVRIKSTIIKVSYDTTNNSQTLPGQIYYAYLDITPAQNYDIGVIYTITISPTTSVASNKLVRIKDLMSNTYEETCYSDVLNCQLNSSPLCVSIPQIQKAKCDIGKSQDKITFQINQKIIIGQTFRIKVEVQNPLIALSADIKIHGLSINTQRTTENGIFVTALQTLIIKIFKGRFNFMWGLSQQELGLQNDVPYTLFKSQGLPVVNSVYISFQVSQSVPMGQEYYVDVSLGAASGIIENSIVTNLPRLDYQKEPKCYQKKYPSTISIACESVGALIQPNFEYFISVKVQYTSTSLVSSPSSVTGYGAVKICIKNSLFDTLYQSYLGETVVIQDNTDFYDVAGFNQNFGLGTTQIISYTDSKQKSGVPDGVENFLSSTRKNTVGIIPMDTADQQLLFFLKVDPTNLLKNTIGTVTGQKYILRMNILYNPKVIIYEQGYDSMGLDFAAFQVATATDPDKWSIDQVQCYKQNTCSWYNQTNIIGAKNYLQKSSASATVPYNIHRFECIYTALATPSPNSDCDNWKGYQKNDAFGGVFSMRRIKFRSGFHSQVQPDDDLLDFVISFDIALYTAGVNPVYSLASTQLINAYTIQQSPLKTSKISFINFSENSRNPGHRFPTFLRVGGSISKTEHLGATAIAVFFDESFELKVYLDSYNSANQAQKDIGCSASKCYFYNSNSIIGQETWMNNNMVLATGLADIENDFNLLIPVQSKLDINNDVIMPQRLVVAFCDFQKISQGVPNQLRILSAYRVYGAPTQQDITQQIKPFFTKSALQPLNFLADVWANKPTNQSKYKLNMNDVKPQGVIDTQFTDTNNVMANHNSNYAIGQYGAGFTISSLYYDIFGPSTLGLVSPPFGVLKTCVKFSYTYNSDILSTFSDFDKFKIYNIFCPVDAALTGIADISWKNPFFDYAFSSQLNLSPILIYSFSSGQGTIYSYNTETQIVASTFYNNCIANQVMSQLRPMSIGKQAVDFSIQIRGKIPFHSNGESGYGFMVVNLELTSNLSNLTLKPPQCEITNYLSSYFSCSILLTANVWQVTFTPIVTFYYYDLLENLAFTIYVDASNQPALSGSAILQYNVKIYLPTQKLSGDIRVFGNKNSSPLTGNYINFAQCLGNTFLIGTSPYGQALTLDNLKFSVKNSNYKSPFNFTFISSPRERFYSTSYYQFDLGFLIAPYQSITSRTSYIRCSIYEAPVSSTAITYDQFQLSWRWKYISYSSDLRDIKLYPKTQFSNPDLIVFSFKCLGTYTPDSSKSTLNIQAYWKDDLYTIQTTTATGSISWATAIATSSIDTTIISPNLTPKLYSKLYSQQGFEASYTFEIESSLSLNYFSRIYINFPYYVGVGMDREVSPECYTRVNNIPTPILYSDFKLAYCEIIGDNRMSLWLNQILSANAKFHITIHGIAQPSLSNKSTTTSDKEIWIGIDDDAILSNGIKQFGSLTDIQAPASTALQKSFIIESLTISNTLIRQKFDLTIQFDVSSQQINSLTPFYVLFTNNFSDNKIGDVLTCTVTQINTNNVLPSTICTFVTQRMIQIKLSTTPTSTVDFKYSLIIQQISSPIYQPELVKNQIRLYLFESQDSLSGTSIVSQVSRLSLDYYSNFYSFTKDTTKRDLIWYIYNTNRSVNSTNSNMIVQKQTLERTRTVFVNIGYYKRIIKLKPENDQTYILSLSLNLSGQTSLFKFIPSTFSTTRGSDSIELRMGALTTTPTGIFSLSATKIGDDSNLYAIVPNLKVIVSGEACQIQARKYDYEIPISGVSLPIELDFFSCMPLDDVIFTPLLTNTNSNDLEFDTNYLVNKITGSSKDSRMYFVINEKTNDSTKVNLSVILTFKVSGTNELSYLPPNQINIKYITQANNVAPIATAIPDVIVDQNKATFQIQCDQPGIAYWVIGIDPSVTSITQSDIKKMVTGVNGLQPTATESATDSKQKVYGFDVSYVNKPIIKVFDTLQANSYYSFKYFCYNQMKLSSSSESISWKIPDNGAYLLKIVFYFSGMLTFKQQMQITCSIKTYFTLPSQRVVSDQNTRCNEYPNYVNLNVENLNVKNKINSYYPYMFYIQPDYTVKQDTTNIDIREQIRENNFITNFLTSVPNSSTYPTIVSIETQNNIFTDSADIVVTSQLQQFSTTAVSYLKLRNINGFIIVGLEEGKSNISPTPDQIKKGLNFYDRNLVTFDMRYSQREVSQEFKFIQLKPGTDYTAYFIGSNDDPSSNAKVTEPIIISFKTQGQKYAVETVSGKMLIFTTLIVLLSLIL